MAATNVLTIWQTNRGKVLVHLFLGGEVPGPVAYTKCWQASWGYNVYADLPVLPGLYFMVRGVGEGVEVAQLHRNFQRGIRD
jgi:hypothetical protein